MKKIITIALLACFGCSELLEETPKGQVLGSFALQNIDGLEAALTGAYKPWGNTWTSGFNTAAILGVVMGSDDLTTHKGSNKASFREFDQFTVTALNDRMGVIWFGCYKAIQGANNVIGNYQALLGGADEARVNQIAGEAYFIRAYSYYWLVRLWGRIPVVTKAEVTDEVLKIDLSEPQVVYDLIVNDLLQAEPLMAPTKRHPGRASRGSAKALLADVYLTTGGWPINDASSYAKAATKAKEVIDEKALFGFDLVPDLSVLWNGEPTTGSPNGSPEEVFSMHHCGSCQWFTSNAVFGNATMPGEENGWDDYFTELKFFNDFPAGIRKDVTFSLVFNNGTIPWQNLTTQHPYYKKFRLKNDELTWQTSMQLTLIRYAHVLLIYAEAQARADGSPNADAYQAVNVIRQRAGLTALSGLSTSAFVDAVVQERAWEFAGEYTRWFDLVRLDKVGAANSGKDPNDLPVVGTITSGDYWLPIPSGDASINPKLGE